MAEKAGKGRLYLVGTPIGNLEDITLRALRVLREADLIAAEDTRRARKLLSRYEIHTPLTSYHGHNEREKAEALAGEVEKGKKVALVSDAGMPGISDPGFRAVEECVRRGLEVEVVPGPSSLTAALALSGLPLARFRYEGFLPAARTKRRSRLLELLREGEAVVLCEAPHRVLDTLEDIAELAPARRMVVAREMTKLHEEVMRGTAEGLREALRSREPRGEFVLVLAPAEREEAPPLTELAEEVAALVREGEATREAVRAVAKRYGVSQRDVYRSWLERKGRKAEGR